MIDSQCGEAPRKNYFPFGNFQDLYFRRLLDQCLTVLIKKPVGPRRPRHSLSAPSKLHHLPPEIKTVLEPHVFPGFQPHEKTSTCHPNIFLRSPRIQSKIDDQGYDTLQALPPAVKAALLSHMERAKFCGTAGAAADASLSRGGSGGSGGSVAPLRHQRNGRSGRSVTVQRKRGGWVARCGQKEVAANHTLDLIVTGKTM